VSGIGALNFTKLYYITVPTPTPTVSPEMVAQRQGTLISGTIFFVFAVVILASLCAWQFIQGKKNGRKDSSANYDKMTANEENHNPMYVDEEMEAPAPYIDDSDAVL
jgi:hypothetical protein